MEPGDKLLFTLYNKYNHRFHRMSTTASFFKHERTTAERIDKFISPHHFLDCNLRGRLFPTKSPVSNLKHVDLGQTRPKFEDAISALKQGGCRVSEGFEFGPTWSTHWFEVQLEDIACKDDCRTFFMWNSGCEAMVWSDDAKPLQGLSSDHNRVLFPLQLLNNQKSFYLEVACNDLIGAGDGGMIEPPKENKMFRIEDAKFVQRNENVYNLIIDLEILADMVKSLNKTHHQRYNALYCANEMLNIIIEGNHSKESYSKARNLSKEFFSVTNGGSMMQIYAVGNCHIDTAWLWPYAETRRKTARSWVTTLQLMKQFPKLTFAVSQAQQLDWLREDYPCLWKDISNAMRNGKFVCVGGSWVEMDGLIPSGESLVRQTLYGQQLFKELSGKYCTEFWLPDTFGYSGQLPQIMCQGGMKRFVTQKLSWNLVNRFPHHTFWWSGLDGTQVLTHFPPNAYVAEIKVEELLKQYNEFEDKGRSNSSLLLYGHGDGGGGPSENILQRMNRLTNVDSMPKICGSTAAKFFDVVESKDSGKLCTWRGELYLELHNGTYTSQAAIKKYNRICENILRDVELLSVFDWFCGREIRHWSNEWKAVLLNQFHDVLPGSSINIVYKDATIIYKNVLEACDKYMKGKGEEHLLNSLPWSRDVNFKGSKVTMPPLSVTPVKLLQQAQAKPLNSIVCEKIDGNRLRVVNKYIDITFNTGGQIVKLNIGDLQIIKENDGFGNELCLYDDVPLFWDAWDVMDYHVETRTVLNSAVGDLKVVHVDDQTVKLQFKLDIGYNSSILTQTIVMEADNPCVRFETTVDWREKHKFLKSEFTCNVNALDATYEIQYGHVKRPTHRNTSWDAAKFEVCGHRWADLSDVSGGCALLNDCKYGYSCQDKTLCISLLRAPTAPDKHCDMGVHEFTYVLMPHTGDLMRAAQFCGKSVLQTAAELNSPVRNIYRPLAEGLHAKLFSIHEHCAKVIIDTIKISEDETGVIVRLYESTGGQNTVTLHSLKTMKLVGLCNNMEDVISDIPVQKSNNSITLKFKAFEYKTLKINL